MPDRGGKFLLALCAAVAFAALAAPAAPAAKPKLSIKNASATEGNKLVFVVTLSRRINRPASARFRTVPGSASNADFVRRSGRVVVKARRRKARIVIATVEDTADEVDERMFVTLKRPRAARLGRARAAGTIVDDDLPANPGTPPPTVSFAGNAVGAEGDPATPGTASVPIVLSHPHTQPVSVNYSLTGGTASAGDFAAPSGTVSIPAGEISTLLTLNLVGDLAPEGTETGNFALSNPVNATLGTSTATVTISEAAAAFGDLVITEIMAAPNGTEATLEYLEIHNTSASEAYVEGLQLFVGPNLRCTLTGSIGPGDFFVLSPDPLIRDQSCPLTLTTSGEVQLQTPGGGGAVLDHWAYSTATNGRSFSLDPDFLTPLGNDSNTNYCTSNSSYGTDGNFGTPGSANEQCP